MATLKGFQSNEIKPQPGFEPSMSSNGAWSGTHTFSMSRESFGNTAVRSRFRKGVSVTSLDPDVPSFFTFMTLDSLKVSFDVGGLVHITVLFAGAEGAQYGGDDGLTGGAEPTYTLDGALAEKPFADHPKWEGLTDLQKEALGRMIAGDAAIKKIGSNFQFGYWEGNSFWAISEYDGICTGNCFEFARRIEAGKTTYEVPVVTWTERTEGNAGLTNAQLNKLGNVATPRGSPPEPTGDRDWKITSTHQASTGTKFMTELVWTLSERGGHDSFLYDD